ncbi:HD domain-containing protein [Helcococcus massiliensis]|uniref:HD domain-containing protein n=1 Tax=Helcococcus massiliensis TaxID=2040290 RepID=UPI000CDEF7F6|nr:HD domain-containing protein [Helcococcus massiliensis]
MEELRFVVLLEEMKKIYRQTKIIGEDRKENDAEHSFHVASMAIFLEEISDIEVDINKVVKMLLIHDYVEIFAGDTYAYNEDRKVGQFQREKDAMDKLKEYLSENNSKLLESLWLEFEERQTNEAKFAVAMDRLQPILSNIYRNDGGTWKVNQVKISQVFERIKPIKDFNEKIYSYIKDEVEKSVEKGFLIDDIGLGGGNE